MPRVYNDTLKYIDLVFSTKDRVESIEKDGWPIAGGPLKPGFVLSGVSESYEQENRGQTGRFPESQLSVKRNRDLIPAVFWPSPASAFLRC